jgi:hypothetical protein
MSPRSLRADQASTAVKEGPSTDFLSERSDGLASTVPACYARVKRLLVNLLGLSSFKFQELAVPCQVR